MQKKRPNERFFFFYPLRLIASSPNRLLASTPYTLHCSSAARLLAFRQRYKNMLQQLGIYSPRRVAVLLPHEMLLNQVV